MQTETVKNILPALCETPKSQMSSKEFQRMLYSWFEEKGLVSDLRSYLRVLMINELRNTTVGKVEPRASFSLSKQAFSLIIAEHLLREGCHYTLSIFSTEVPGVANQLPFSFFEAHCRNEEWRFDQESLFNVLELIGVSKGSNESLRISSLYFRSNNSLLTCLLNSKTVVEVSVEETEGDYLEKILTVLGVPPSLAQDIKKKIEDGFMQRIPTERRHIEEMTQVLIERNNQMKVLVDEQIALKNDNKKLRNELKATQKRLKQAVLKEQNLNFKETEIRRKLEEVSKLQKSLEKAMSRERVEACEQKHCTEVCQSRESLNEELRGEVFKLEENNREKKLEIERLNVKMAALIKDLQNSRLNIEFLNTCLQRSSQINLQQGEEPPCSSEDSSENLTGEIIKQVRAKLHQLEAESDQLEIKLKKLKLTNVVTK